MVERELEQHVRDVAGLLPHYQLHPKGTNSILKQAEAISFAADLLARGDYEDYHLGFFARDLSHTGAKTFFVDTFAGLALDSAKRAPPVLWDVVRHDEPPRLDCYEKNHYKQHLYEVISDGRPCWLYFDLEFSRIANPTSNVNTVTEEFYLALDRYFVNTFGSPCDRDSVVELDSTTPEKYSKHVLVKRLTNGQPLAFANNSYAGVLVADLITHLQREYEQRSCFGIKQLFFSSGKKAEGEEDCRPSVCLIDGCVYSRNRCFRLLFSSKFAKNEPLLMSRGQTCLSPPPLQLLSSFASFVPANTSYFTHPRISMPLERVQGASPGSKLQKGRQGRLQMFDAHAPEIARPDFLRVALQEGSPYLALFDFLVEHWDQTRAEHEADRDASPNKTRVQSSVLIGDGKYLCVTLGHNRFCLRKGASHKSNSIYFVVDTVRHVFYQKCHDVADCGRDFKSDETAVPPNLICASWEKHAPASLEMTQEILSQAVEETQQFVSQTKPLDGDFAEPTLLISTAVAHLNATRLSQTLRLCSCSDDPTYIVCTPPSKPSSIFLDGATPEKPEATSLRDKTNLAWHASLHFVPTIPDKPSDNETQYFISKTQVDSCSDGDMLSVGGTEVDPDSEPESAPSQNKEELVKRGIAPLGQTRVTPTIVPNICPTNKETEPTQYTARKKPSRQRLLDRGGAREAARIAKTAIQNAALQQELRSSECVDNKNIIDALLDDNNVRSECSSRVFAKQHPYNSLSVVGWRNMADHLWSDSEDEKSVSVERHLGNLSNKLWGEDDDQISQRPNRISAAISSSSRHHDTHEMSCNRISLPSAVATLQSSCVSTNASTPVPKSAHKKREGCRCCARELSGSYVGLSKRARALVSSTTG